MDKNQELIKYLRQFESLAIAFSGGVDSTYLLRVAKEALGDKVVAITVKTPYTPKWELEEGKQLVKAIGVNHEIVEINHIPRDIKLNPKERCYLCKKYLFSQIIARANHMDISTIADGSNFDDTKDYRPGMRALKELKVISPLLINEFTKEEIRRFSKEYNLSTWDKPPYACLLTRVEIGEEVVEEKLERIEKAEVYLKGLGFQGCRVRTHGDLARIEVKGTDLDKITKLELMKEISFNLKNLGYRYVTLDMEGYKMGSLN